MAVEVRERKITVEAAAGPVTVRFGGRDIVSTDAALVMREGDYGPVLYVPRADTDMNALEPTAHTTHCTYKGDASYFSIVVGEARADNAVWSYDAPLDDVAAIRGYLAFDGDKVEISGGL